MTASRPPKRYPRDQRWSAAVVLTVLGAALFVVTWLLSGEGWRALAVNAGYTIGGALLTFAVLYLVSQRFESWEWIREDHDLVKRFDDELRDDAKPRSRAWHPRSRHRSGGRCPGRMGSLRRSSEFGRPVDGPPFAPELVGVPRQNGEPSWLAP